MRSVDYPDCLEATVSETVTFNHWRAGENRPASGPAQILIIKEFGGIWM